MKSRIIGLLVCLLSLGNIIAQNSEIINFNQQEIIINNFDSKGLILDIGGGGEGVIGQLKGEQAISIDLFKDELENAPSTNLKIVMDARDLKFIDNSFNNVVIFYTLMYIKSKDHEKVFNEVKRVLKNGGNLKIWDVNLPISSDTTKKLIAYYPFKFILPHKEINTGYGAPFPKNEKHDMEYYIGLAKKAGFQVVKSENKENSFYIEFKAFKSIADTIHKK